MRETLTNAELKVFGLLISTGLTHKQIARRLYIEPTTVRHHVSNICSKYGVNTVRELVIKHYKKQLEGTNEQCNV